MSNKEWNWERNEYHNQIGQSTRGKEKFIASESKLDSKSSDATSPQTSFYYANCIKTECKKKKKLKAKKRYERNVNLCEGSIIGCLSTTSK